MGGHGGTKLRDAACQDLHPFHAAVSPFPFVYPAAQFHMAPSPSWVLGTHMWACPQCTAIPGLPLLQHGDGTEMSCASHHEAARQT